MNGRVLRSAASYAAALFLTSVQLSPASAGTGPHRFSHPVTASRDDVSRNRLSAVTFPDTIRLLAVMVQFQADTDIRTTGDGRFVLTAPADSVIDAPPRDRRYFEQHLTFLTNYYRKSSKGKIVILPTVVDSVFTLRNRMERYSPQDGGVREVVDLARDAWQLVDSSGIVPDFSAFRCFVVFHAGVGRDIDLVATLGYDPAPLDIPSLFLGPNAFRDAYGPAYRGVPVRGGFFVTNTLVIPETESRSVPGLTGDILLELSINGLLCASFGNYLGLPDLFDTNTGRSGIGRFGLMDGQAIFSFAGLFPPEPSAWEKYWLGWIEPMDVPSPATAYTLPAVALADSILRVAISGPEYYLVENRSRDPQRNGQRITFVFNGVQYDLRFARDTSGINAFDVSRLAGVVTDVEDLDWSLPGGVDNNGVFYDGGILIWHIDEGVIQDRIASNAVNADPSVRGVDLEEADGSQDIGQVYEQFSPGSGSEEGTVLDFWFDGNVSPVYRNEFGSSTFPDTRSNTGAYSHVTVKGISVRGPRMTVTVDRSGGTVRPLPGFPMTTGEQTGLPALAAADLGGSAAAEIVLITLGRPAGGFRPEGYSPPADTGRGKVYIWQSDSGAPLPGLRNDGVAAVLGQGEVFVPLPALVDLNGDGRRELLVTESSSAGADRLRLYAPAVPAGDSTATPVFATSEGSTGYGEPVGGDSLIAVPVRHDRVFFFRADGKLVDSLSLGLPSATALSAAVCRWSAPGSFVVTGSDGTVLITHRLTRGPLPPDRRVNIGTKIHGRPAAGSFRSGARLFDGIALLAGDRASLLYLLDLELNVVPGFPVELGDTAEWIALGDIDGDGGRDIVVCAGSQVLVYSAAGVSVENFPRRLPGKNISTPPVIADVNGDGRPDIVGATADGVLFAFGPDGRQPVGFPLQVAVSPRGVVVFDAGPAAPSGTPIGIAALSGEQGTLSAWVTGSAVAPPGPATRPWPMARHDADNSGAAFEALPGTPPSSQFFPPSRVYNWPNPVYDTKTFLRYYLGDNATVRISVYDFAGDKVTEFDGPGIGGMDNEAVWDVSGVQSGVYYARIEANGGGRSGVAIVKVAVVK